MVTALNGGRSWTLQSVNNAINGRYHMGALLPHLAGAAPLSGWRDGVITSTNFGGASNLPRDLQVVPTSPSPSMSLTVQPGHAVNSRSANAMYLSYLSTAGDVTLDTAPTLNPRRDLIYARIYDAALGDGMPSSPALTTPGGFRIEVISGTPGAVPVLPSLPAGGIPLANVLVGVGVGSIVAGNITDIRKSAATPGGARCMLPGDLAADPGAVSGELRFTTSATDSGLRVWNGANWKSPGPPVFANVAAMVAGIPTPYQNETAWVNDENRLYRWDGASWQIAKATGFKGGNTTAGGITTVTAETLYKSVTFTAESSHIYKASAAFNISTAAGASQASFSWRWAAGATVTTAGTQFALNPHQVNTGVHNYVTPWRSLPWGAATAQITVGLFIIGSGSGVFLDPTAPREILIEDMV